MQPDAFRAAVERTIHAHQLIPPGGEVTCLVSGGPDSTCLLHVLRALDYRIRALHVDHGLRGADSEEDARFCRDVLGAEVADGRGGRTEDQLRRIRYGFAIDRLRATGHTLDDQAETVLLELVRRGRIDGIRPRRADGVVRPLLERTRAEVESYLAAENLAFRTDASNRDTRRGLIRERIVPLLRDLHPDAVANLARAAERRTLPPPLADLLDAPVGSRRADLGGGRTAVREYDSVWLERTPVALDGEVRWGAWVITADEPGLKVRAWRAGDRLAGRRRKVQDVFVDAKVPRSERESWPLVVRGDEVVAVPGLVQAPGVTAARVGER